MSRTKYLVEFSGAGIGWNQLLEFGIGSGIDLIEPEKFGPSVGPRRDQVQLQYLVPKLICFILYFPLRKFIAEAKIP